MTLPPLVLYGRTGCCLCEGLEERLRQLDPPPPLEVVDVDPDPALKARYGLEVPVLSLRLEAGLRELPRVPPRLGGDGLRRWLLRAAAAAAQPPS